MKYARDFMLVIVFVAVCFSYSSAGVGHIAGASDEKVFIELDYLPKAVKPGDKPITLSENLLSKLLPELRNPRRMSFQDLIDPMEQDEFLEGGYAFVLTGDFNRDRIADIAFVGKYDNPDNPESNSFIAIVSIKGNQVIREYFSKLETKKVYLIKVLDYKPKMDAIGMVFTFGSEECGYLYWTGKKYSFKLCQAVF